ncbi:hypothetical protein [Natronosalvus rutilus]|uniref:Uncharacterized protein n=1 Tax=Natronosalvus rutilus TaxID=2953753 RepID=A0A9E7NBI5_9EURY|nr:hypothetical protein [Natronosalvus rutilus]UTF53959.1 hypothetical protein NGM29_01345 [Natronosalvus rutilus]
MVLQRLNRYGYAVLGCLIAALASVIAGVSEFAWAFLVLSGVLLWLALTRNTRSDSEGVYPHDREPDPEAEEERTRTRESELEGDKARGGGLG